MKISITCEDFPVQMIDKMVADLAKHGLPISIQVGFFDTLFATTEVDDVTKAQIFCIIIDKYKFAHGVEGDGLDEYTRQILRRPPSTFY